MTINPTHQRPHTATGAGTEQNHVTYACPCGHLQRAPKPAPGAHPGAINTSPHEANCPLRMDRGAA